MPAKPPATTSNSSGQESSRKPFTRLLPVYFIFILASSLMPVIIHLGFAVYDESVFTKKTKPIWAWNLLEKDLYEFYGQYQRWPTSLDEFFTIGKSWAKDAKTQQSRILKCRVGACTALFAANYLYLYKALPNGAAAVWMLPQAALPPVLPYSYRDSPEATARQALQWQQEAASYFAACLPGARCRLWKRLGAPVNVTPAPPPETVALNARDLPPGRSVLTLPEASAQFEPSVEFLAKYGFVEVKAGAPKT